MGLDTWRAQCPAQALACIDALRSAIREAGPDLVETIKWNAPNFAQNGDDRITLGLERDGGVRVVLHRGATRRIDGFVFEDRSGLAQWPTPDRGVIRFRHKDEVNQHRPALVDLLSCWLKATQ